MSYSQKYCLVSFIQPINSGAEFNMTDWPLHVTLVDVFAIDRESTNIESELAELLSNQPSVDTFASKESILGTAEVVLLEKTGELINLHTNLIDLLEKNGAIFNSPEFTREGFLPHSTIQKTGKIHVGDKVAINTITFVDMFPNGDWRQRRILNIFKLQSVPAE
jgi:hypothetical protein